MRPLLQWFFAAVLLLAVPDAVTAACPVDTPRLRVRSPIGFYPVTHDTRINGLALGFLEETWQGAEQLQLNGLVLQLNPIAIGLGVLFTGYVLLTPVEMFTPVDTPLPEFGAGGSPLFTDRAFDEPGSAPKIRINGLALGSGLIGEGIWLNGMAIGLVHAVEHTRGIQIGVMQNLCTALDGVSLSIRNKATRVRGVQIGLYNTCREGRVVQIGLLNRIGRRLTPFVNFQFRNSKKPFRPGRRPLAS